MAKHLAPAMVKLLKHTYQYECVLLIDDDDITNFLNEDILKSMELSPTIKSTRSVEEAIKLLSYCYSNGGQSSMLIFLDLIMPANSRDGFDFLEEIRMRTDIPIEKIDIVVLTNSLDLINKEKAEKYNITDYVAKPLSTEKINAALAKKLNSPL